MEDTYTLHEDAYRFATLTDDNIDIFLEENRSENIIKNTIWISLGIGLYNKWRRIERNARNNKKFQNYSQAFVFMLSKIIDEARGQDGKEYPQNAWYYINT